MRTLMISCLLLSACGDSTSHANIHNYADYVRVAVPEFCQLYVRCGIFSASQSGNCQTALAAQVGSQTKLYDYDAAIQAGKIAFDGAAASSCLDALSASACDLSGLLSAASNNSCQNVVKGLVPNGGACKSPLECQDGYCEGSTSPGCAGTCHAFAATGAACGTGAVTCRRSDICTNSICVARAAQGGACASSSDCSDGLFCNNHICQTASAEGGPCTGGGFASDCQAGLYCDRSVTSPVCKKRIDTGGACTSSGQCRDGLACSTQNVCQTIADVGQSCSTSACAEDASCDATATCKLGGQLGSDCASSSCGLNLYCDANKKCVQKIPFGGACDPTGPSGQCQLGNCDVTSKTCTLVCT
jgi:hypothetical protein